MQKVKPGVMVMAVVGLLGAGVLGWWVAGRMSGGEGPVAVPVVPVERGEGDATGRVQPDRTAPAVVLAEPPTPLEVIDPVVRLSTGRQTAMALMPDGKSFLAIQSDINRARGQGTIDSLLLCDATSGAVLRTLTGPSDKDENQFRVAALSPDGKYAATGNFYGWVRLWDVEKGVELAQWREGRIVESVAFSPDGTRLATGGYAVNGAPNIDVYDLEKKTRVMELKGHTVEGWGPGIVPTLAFSPDGKRLVSGGDDQTVRVWDMATGAEIYRVEGHSQGVACVAVSPDGKMFASSGRDGRVCVYAMETGKLLRSLREPEDERTGNRTVVRVVFTPDSQRLLMLAQGSGRGAGVKLLDIESWQVLVTFHAWGGVLLLAPDGTTFLAQGGVFAIPQAISVPAFKGVPLADAPAQAALVMRAGPRAGGVRQDTVTALKLLSGKELLAAYDAGPETYWVKWDWATGREIGRVALQEKTPDAPPSIKAVSADGKMMAGASMAGPLMVVNAATGETIRRMNSPADAMIYRAAFSPDGKWLLGSETPRKKDGNQADIDIWNVATGELVRKLEGSTDLIWALAVTPDGKRVVSGSGSTDSPPGASGENSRCYVRVWDFASGKELLKLEGMTGVVDAVDITPDGRWAITGGNVGRPIVWDLEAGKEVARLNAHLNRDGNLQTLSVALSDDGKFAATGGADHDIRIYNVEFGRELGRFETHKGRVTALKFLPDGKRLLSGAADGTVREWVLP